MAATSDRFLFQYNVDDLTHTLYKLCDDAPTLEIRRVIFVTLEINNIMVNSVRTSDGKIISAGDHIKIPTPQKVQFAIFPEEYDDKKTCRRCILNSLEAHNVNRGREYFMTRILAYVMQLAERVPTKGMDYEANDIKVHGHLSVVWHRIVDEDTVLRGLKKTTISESCAICLEESSCVREFTITPCSHVFHNSCIAPWLVNKDSCPMCRRPVRTLSLDLIN